MPAEPESLALAAEFPAQTRDAWRTLVAEVLAKSGRAGADPEAALSHTTYDGITIAPLYTADDAPATAMGLPGHAPFVRGSTLDGATGRGWDVRTRHVVSDATRANTAVLADLEAGATSLWLELDDASVEDLDRILDGVHLDLAPIVLDAGSHTARAAAALLSLAEGRGVDPAKLRGSLGADPIGRRARTGADADLGSLLALAEQSEPAVGLCVASVDATAYHDAGASDAQELGIAAAVGVAYLRALVEGGLPVDIALAALEFRYAVTAEQFPSIAKLRAARRIWDRVAELSGASADRRGQRQHAVTSAAMLTRRDPWVNMLRTTIACFAAAVGGAEAITVLPFDAAVGVSDDFARRIARNTQAVLHDESSLARVIDAAGGSWFVESLTDSLAEAAWTVFTDIEKHGGALAALDDGTLDRLIGETRARRDDDIAHRRAPITGVSEFAFAGEEALERSPLPPAPEGLLPRVRYAQDFERLRDRSDAASERPRVFLAALGPLAQHAARASFVTNLLAAGGVEPEIGTAEAGAIGSIVDAFRQSKTAVAVLCSSDKIYEHAAEPVATALREAGAEQVWLAGRFECAALDGNVYVGCDVLGTLRSMLAALEAGG